MLAVLAVLELGVLKGQGGAECATVWNGFTQSWGYNHRLKRMGDWVAPVGDGSCDFTRGHAGETGTGPDSLRYRQYGMAVEAPGVGFYQAELGMLLEGNEGEWIEVVGEGSLFHTSLGEEGTAATVVLNGFDLRTSIGADKLGEFEVVIDSVWRDLEARKLHYRVRAGLRMSCRTAECGWLDRRVSYELEVAVLAVVDGDFVVVDGALVGTQSWTRDSIAPVPERVGYVRCPAGMAMYLPGIYGVHGHLSGEMHLLGWDSWLELEGVDGNGLVRLRYGLGVRQWDAEMYAAYRMRYDRFPKFPAKWVVKRQAGSAAMGMDVRVLGFRAGEVVSSQ